MFDFTVFGKYHKNISLDSFSQYFNDIEKKKLSFINDLNRYFYENRQRNSKYWVNSDEVISGKASEFRIGCILKNEGHIVKSTADGSLEPDKRETSNILKNKYIDLIVDDNKIFEIKTISNIEFKQENLLCYIRQKAENFLIDIRKKKYEDISDYCIINAALKWYYPDILNDENCGFYMNFFNKTFVNKSRKWNSTSSLFETSVQDLFVYDLKEKRIVYINPNSFMFKKIQFTSVDGRTFYTREFNKKDIIDTIIKIRDY